MKLQDLTIWEEIELTAVGGGQVARLNSGSDNDPTLGTLASKASPLEGAANAAVNQRFSSFGPLLGGKYLY